MTNSLSTLMTDCADDVRRYLEGRKAAKKFVMGQAIKRLSMDFIKHDPKGLDAAVQDNILTIAKHYVDASFMRLAFKLMRKRKDGSLGSLFINKKEVYPTGKWMWARDIPMRGYAHRPGWHLTPRPHAPHLSLKDRVWVFCEVQYVKEHEKPEAQGGKWILAKRMRILGEV